MFLTILAITVYKRLIRLLYDIRVKGVSCVYIKKNKKNNLNSFNAEKIFGGSYNVSITKQDICV